MLVPWHAAVCVFVREACWPSLARCGSQGNPDVGDYHLTQRTCASCRRDAGFSPFPLCFFVDS